MFKRLTLVVAEGKVPANPSEPPAFVVDVIAETTVLPVVAVYWVVELLIESTPVCLISTIILETPSQT